jgi:hypothetical protein
MFENLLQPSHLVVMLVLVGAGIIFIFPWWMIFSKAGFPGPLALLMWVPLINVILLFWLALTRWPNSFQKDAGTACSLCPNCGTAVIGHQ